MAIVTTDDLESRFCPFPMEEVKANSIRIKNQLEDKSGEYNFKYRNGDLSVDSFGYCIENNGEKVGEVFIDLIITGGYYEDEGRYHCFVLGAAEYSDVNKDTQCSIILNPSISLMEQLNRVATEPDDYTEFRIARILSGAGPAKQKLIEAIGLIQEEIDLSQHLSPDAKDITAKMLPRGRPRRTPRPNNVISLAKYRNSKKK